MVCSYYYIRFGGEIGLAEKFKVNAYQKQDFLLPG
jgi:hypothetical protein